MINFIRKKLKLVPSGKSGKGYDSTIESCNILNMYYQDFIESFSILSEKKKSGDSSSLDVDDSLIYMESQIQNISRAMEIMAEQMGDVVKLEDGE